MISVGCAINRKILTKTTNLKCLLYALPVDGGVSKIRPLHFFFNNSFFRHHLAHPSCIEMPPRMAIRVQDYDWQCTECKHCSKCRRIDHVDKMLFCDQCDRGYHIYCIGLRGVPEGESKINALHTCVYFLRIGIENISTSDIFDLTIL